MNIFQKNKWLCITAPSWIDNYSDPWNVCYETLKSTTRPSKSCGKLIMTPNEANRVPPRTQYKVQTSFPLQLWGLVCV